MQQLSQQGLFVELWAMNAMCPETNSSALISVSETLKLDHIAIWVAGEETVDSEFVEVARRTKEIGPFVF